MQEMCYTGIVQRQPANGTYLSSRGRGLFSEFAPSAFCYTYMRRAIVMKHEEVPKYVELPLSEITPYEGNARKHTQEDIDVIAQSIADLGFADPIGVWGEKNIIVEGHGRYYAAKKLGIKKVPCIRLDYMTISKAVLLLCNIKHNRDADLLSNYIYDRKELISDSDIEKYFDEVRAEPMQIPEYVYDCHTLKGKKAGKTKTDFFKQEQKSLFNEEPSIFGEQLSFF